MSLSVRRAQPDDAAAISRVLVASITALCTADHGNDPAVIAAWTANKSEANILVMLSGSESTIFVVEQDAEIVGVGAIAGPSISLNYVDPRHRCKGVSSTLLATLEAELVMRGVDVAELKSTATARAFYLSQGWVESAPATPGRFISAHPMRKRLSSVLTSSGQ